MMTNIDELKLVLTETTKEIQRLKNQLEYLEKDWDRTRDLYIEGAEGDLWKDEMRYLGKAGKVESKMKRMESRLDKLQAKLIRAIGYPDAREFFDQISSEENQVEEDFIKG